MKQLLSCLLVILAGCVGDAKKGLQPAFSLDTGEERPVSRLVFSPDDRWLVRDGLGIIVWSVDSFKLHKKLIKEDKHCDFGFSDNGKLLIGLSGRTVFVWNTASFKLREQLEIGDPSFFAVCPTTDTFFVVNREYKKPLVKNLSTGDTTELDKSEARYTYPTFSPDGKRLVAISGHEQVVAWDTKTWKKAGISEAQKEILGNLCYAPDSKTFIVLADNKANLWDANKLEPLHVFPASFPEEAVSGAVYTSDSKHVITVGGERAKITVWEVASRKRVASFQLNRILEKIAISNDGRWLATSNSRSRLEVWDYQKLLKDAEKKDN